MLLFIAVLVGMGALVYLIFTLQKDGDARFIQSRLKAQQKVLKSITPSFAGQFSMTGVKMVKGPFERARRVYDCTIEDRFGTVKSCTIYVVGGEMKVTNEKTIKRGRSMYDDIGQ